jgi:hypothetical protein
MLDSSFDWYRQVIASNGRSLLDRGVMPVAQVTLGRPRSGPSSIRRWVS